LIALWSASAVQKGHADFRGQVIGIVLALPVVFLFLAVEPRIWAVHSRIVYCVMLALLLLVKVPGLGRAAGGAERWVQIGPVGFQPSELAKILVVITFADFLAREGSSLRTVGGFVKSLLHILPPFLLVALQPSLSASLTFLAIWGGMSIVAHQRIRNMLGMAAAAVALFLIAWNSGLLKPYQAQRLLDYVSGDYGYHTERSLTSIGSGGLVGQGIGRGPLKEAKYVPEATTDSIFAVISEEGGFVGAVLVVLLYAYFFWRVWLVVMEAESKLYRYMAAGLFVIFSFHTLVNLFVAVGLMPNTGMPLPFISFGRSAMLLCLAGVALLINIRSRERRLVFNR
jgi:rod shape determining protein RodA